ncbi:MAG: 4-alpha-glucanotransferase [Nitrospirales bacterium]
MPNETPEQLVDELAKLFGIDPEYYDIFGHRHVISLETKCAILASMGVHTATPAHMAQELAAVHEATWRQPCEPVLVQRGGIEGTWSLRMPGQDHEDNAIYIEWSIRDEAGRHLLTEKAGPGLQPTDSILLHGQHYWRFHLPLPVGLAAGYYDLTAVGTSSSHQVHGSLRLIIVPPHCYQPAQMETGGRLWGVSLQLYALRSTHNWGVGDFTDLFQWTEWASMELGAGIIGLNPLHALKNSRPYHISPYSPDSRFYLNALYVDVEQAPEFEHSAGAQGIAGEEGFLSSLEALRKSDTVDYERVAAMKRQVLNALFATFEERHFRREGDRLVACTTRGEDFDRYLQREGHALQAFALFQVLYEKFSKESPPQLVWQDWPEAYRYPTSIASQEFLAAHGRQVRFHQYVQWLAHEQLRRVHERTRELAIPIGLYHDLALGSDRGGSDAWIFQSLLALGADCGCPPDAFAPDGQNWGLPPVNPHALRRTGYRMFIDLLRKNLQYGGAIRLDHVMALFRLFWIPRGLPPSAGAYVQYPWDDLLGILALESVRHRAVIVGEDLGTVPDFVRDKLGAAGVLSYRVFYFERGDDGEWKRPAMYPRQALAVVTTHDLPTLAGFWDGEDLRVRERLGFYPDETAYCRVIDERQRDKAGIARALQHEGVWPPGVDNAVALHQPLSSDLAGAVHTYVARSPSSFMLVTLEDLVGDATQVNLPGTLDSYPNWSHKTPLTLNEVKASSHARQLARTLSLARP